MKIVKMHKGNKEAFDDFLKQRLNEVEVDNDAADKYFAEMNLPVPVIPATEISFFAQHKNKLWLLALLFFTSITTFTFLYKTNSNKSDISIDKKSTLDNKKNVAMQSNSYPTKNTEVNNVQQKTKKTTDELLLKNNTQKIENVRNGKLASNNSDKFLVQTKKNKYRNTGKLLDSLEISDQKTGNPTNEKNISSQQKASTTNTIKEPIKTDKKQADSLYIIW